MRRFAQHRLFAMLVALAVLGGFAHLVLERFTAHQHCEVASQGCSDRAPEGGSAPQDGGCHHWLCHHTLLALTEQPAASLPIATPTATLPDLGSGFAPDAEPAAIDHPPQLA
jgi:hypothetical protein